MNYMDEYISCRDKYMKKIAGKTYDYTEYGILADIAWSLHNISAMLMEQNGYIHPYEYLNGEDVNGGDDDECVSE